MNKNNNTRAVIVFPAENPVMPMTDVIKEHLCTPSIETSEEVTNKFVINNVQNEKDTLYDEEEIEGHCSYVVPCAANYLASGSPSRDQPSSTSNLNPPRRIFLIKYDTRDSAVGNKPQLPHCQSPVNDRLQPALTKQSSDSFQDLAQNNSGQSNKQANDIHEEEFRSTNNHHQKQQQQPQSQAPVLLSHAALCLLPGPSEGVSLHDDDPLLGQVQQCRPEHQQNGVSTVSSSNCLSPRPFLTTISQGDGKQPGAIGDHEYLRSDHPHCEPGTSREQSSTHNVTPSLSRPLLIEDEETVRSEVGASTSAHNPELHGVNSSIANNPCVDEICNNSTCGEPNYCGETTQTSSSNTETPIMDTVIAQKCNFCDYSCLTRMALRVHCLRVHLCAPDGGAIKHAPIVCSMCSKHFVCKSQLEKHVRFQHEGLKLIPCPICDYSAVDESSLAKHHRSVHSLECPYSCNQCPKRFKVKSNLIRHERTHSGIQPYACNLCDMRYADKRNLDRHRRNKH